MRWDALFDDLESQLESATAAGLESEIRERTRVEQSRLTLVQRLLGQVGAPVDASTTGGQFLSGTLTHVGSQWISLAVEGRSVIVPLASLRSLRGLGRGVGQVPAGVRTRLGLGAALRALSRDRAQVSLWLGSAARHTGVIDRVGADFFELGLVATGDERRAANVRDALTVPFAAIDALESAAPAE
ncbi:hypothetical protein [Arthrobacter sp. B0490]|uniref:hypothetical protein n=1 Tax=Arthrobacter sp. B0490 TaxID=2058891 RepID=UPI000CE40DA2|nr:hypothetical protein [Arthrobacter sp. B0490]